jgi:two-component system, OmpR family, sensor kinase
MHATSRPSGFWQSVRQLPERIPLRTKLITAVLGLVAIALVIISVAGLSFLRTYLLRTADQQLSSLVRRVESAGPNFQSRGGSFSPETWLVLGVIDGKVVVFPDYGYDPTGSMPQVTPGASWLTSGGPATVPAQVGSETWRVTAIPGQQIGLSSGSTVTGTVIVGLDVTPEYSILGTLTLVDLLISLAVLLLLGLAGVAVIRRSLKPLADIEKTAGAIAAGDLTQRIPEGDPRTEVGRLGRSLNTMLGHIENAFRAQSRSEAAARRSEERMRQFVADASHELRTPLTAIRGFAEYYRQRGGVAGEVFELDEAATGAADADVVKNALNGTSQLSPADLARIMRRVEQESARMGVLVEDMLLLARLDQQRPLEHTTVDLLALAADAVHDARVVAPNRNINLTVDTGAALLVNGDEVRLRQVIGNLMGNALAHTPDGTPVEVHLRSGELEEIWASTGTAHTTGYSAEGLSSQAVAVLEVTDYGPGLTDEQQVHVFERFYRADQARTTHGTGLGLAIVAALVSAHGGAVWVQSEYGYGAKFSIALPLAPEAIHDPDEGSFPDEDAEFLDWHGAHRAGDSPGPRETADPREDGGVPGDFHGATAWRAPASPPTRPSTGSDA